MKYSLKFMNTTSSGPSMTVLLEGFSSMLNEGINYPSTKNELGL